MALNVERVRAARVETRQSYTERDTMLYALGLGVGAGDEVTDPAALRYVYERDLQVIPTMAATLAYPLLWLSDPTFGIDGMQVVNGAQRLEIHNPLPTSASVHSLLTVRAVEDKGPGRGALVHSTRALSNDADGTLLATVQQISFCRGEGGFGGDVVPDPIAHRPIPDRAPDRTINWSTRPEQALIYRLSGDYNPLHADPEVAIAVGFPRPILHGLATFGRAGYALLRDSDRPMTMMEGRYSAPILPGAALACAIWNEADGRAFRVSDAETSRTVLDFGWVC